MTGADQRDRVAKEARNDGSTADILSFKAIQPIFGLTLFLTYLSQTPQPKILTFVISSLYKCTWLAG